MYNLIQLYCFVGDNVDFDGGCCVAAPRVLVIGAGRNSVVRTLVNYAVKMGDNPWVVDLDVANGLISLPGCVGCCQVTVGHHGIRHEEGGIIAAAPSYAYERQQKQRSDDYNEQG